jgi:hypothetical protein
MMIRNMRHAKGRNASRLDSESNTALEINERICTSLMGRGLSRGERDEDGGCKFSSRRKSFVRQEEDQEVAPKKFLGPASALRPAQKIFLQAGTLSACLGWQGSDKADKDLADRVG